MDSIGQPRLFARSVRSVTIRYILDLTDKEGERRVLMDAALGVYAFDALAVLRTAEMPAVLIECGFIVSEYDEWELNKPKYQKAFAQSIAEAIKQLRKQGHASR